jgi:hypothetical protein
LIFIGPPVQRVSGLERRRRWVFLSALVNGEGYILDFKYYMVWVTKSNTEEYWVLRMGHSRLFSFILVMLSLRVIFLESIPTLRYFGIALIILGILLSSVAKG